MANVSHNLYTRRNLSEIVNFLPNFIDTYKCIKQKIAKYAQRHRKLIQTQLVDMETGLVLAFLTFPLTFYCFKRIHIDSEKTQNIVGESNLRYQIHLAVN